MKCYPNRSPEGRPLKAWTKAHWEWVKSIRMPEAADADVLEYYIDRVERAAEEKAALEAKVGELALQARWKPCVDALRCMKGVETVTAFVREVMQWGGVESALFAPLFKTVAIALISRTGADLCRDAGEGAMASLVETAGAFGAVVVSLPLFGAVWELLSGMI